MEDSSSVAEKDTGAESGQKAAKNRVAQQRYRQRQKEKKQNIQQQLQILNRRLASMELERSSLSERHRILQRLAQFADQQAESPALRQTGNPEAALDKEKAKARADFLNRIRRDRQPLLESAQGSDLYCARDQTRMIYVENLADLKARGEIEEMEAYVQDTRAAREEMMVMFDFRDEMRIPYTAKPAHDFTPFKQSMITVMQLSKQQEEDLLSARREFLSQCAVFRRQRESSATDMKKSNLIKSGTKHEVCESILEGVAANDTFMNSIVQEHKCIRQYYNACAHILPNYIEAERSGCLQGWLLEHAPQGSSNMNYQIIAGGSPETQAQEEKPFSGSISAAELEAVGSNQGPDSDLLLLGARSDSLPSLDPSLPGEDLFPSYPSIPADLTGFDAFEASAFGQLFIPSDAVPSLSR